jgi:hypothetical protein
MKFYIAEFCKHWSTSYTCIRTKEQILYIKIYILYFSASITSIIPKSLSERKTFRTKDLQTHWIPSTLFRQCCGFREKLHKNCYAMPTHSQLYSAVFNDGLPNPCEDYRRVRNNFRNTSEDYRSVLLSKLPPSSCTYMHMYQYMFNFDLILLTSINISVLI